MLSREENELLTNTDPETPGGDLLRRYWQPVAMSKELKDDPISVQLLGEELVLFRDEQGQPGLLGLHCPHRGTDLSYGRMESGGIRCLYHGWLFDKDGNCLEQPGEPEGSDFKEKICHLSYPCVETAGIILAYLGKDEPPLLPNYEFLTAPDEYVHVGKVYHDCNYLQGNEGNLDPAHLSFLHAFSQPKETDGVAVEGSSLFGADVSPQIEVEETDFGIRINTLRDVGEDQIYLRTTNFIYPNLSAFTGPLADGYTVNWHVPINNVSHWKYMITFTRKTPVDKEFMDRALFGKEVDEHYYPIRNRQNRYLQNREIMKNWSYSGIGDIPGTAFPSQDLLATESQGYIQDRTSEHLGYTDKAITLQRKLLLRAIRQRQEGKEAPHVIRKPEENRLTHIVVTSETIPATTDWKTYWQVKEEEFHGSQSKNK